MEQKGMGGIMKIPKKEYIGDSVYVDYNGWAYVLTTENGHYASNTIVLEPEILTALIRYKDRLTEALVEQREEAEDEH